MPNEPAAQLAFRTDETDASFKVDAESRTISGIAVPWGSKARSGFSEWKFSENSLHWSKPRNVKMLRDHDHGQPIGHAIKLESHGNGLWTQFKIARGEDGDRALQLAEDGVLDGLSVGIDFTDGDEWQPDPDDSGVRQVNSGTLREVSLTAMPAFDSARVATVAASQKGSSTMGAEAPETAGSGQGSVTASQPDLTEFTSGLSDSIRTAVEEAFKNLPNPQGEREVIPAGQAVVTREAPVYAMNGQGPSLVRDAWKSRTEGNNEARDRLERFQKQTNDAADKALHDAQFAANTSNSSAIIPPGYRPEYYVTQLMQGRPLMSSVSRGTISDATPFTIPKFDSASGLAGEHTEGTNPTAGTLNLGTVTVTPVAVSGLFEMTREIVDSSNPAIDAIAMQAMQEAYSQQTEQQVYSEINANVGQTVDTTGPTGELGGAEFIAGIRQLSSQYQFERFAAPNRGHLSQEGTTALATAVGSDGRPLLPNVGPQNTVGTGNSIMQGWFIDSLAFQPTWSMTGNGANDPDALFFNDNDVWAWESPLLTFRFEERGGPARIDLALFGYFATRVLRPVGVAGVRHTAG